MPHANPQTTFRTPDNNEWKFLQTFSNYDKLDKFRRRNRASTTDPGKNQSVNLTLKIRWEFLGKITQFSLRNYHLDTNFPNLSKRLGHWLYS
jgi:hypothetical protein